MEIDKWGKRLASSGDLSEMRFCLRVEYSGGNMKHKPKSLAHHTKK